MKNKSNKFKWIIIGIIALVLAVCGIIFLAVSYFREHSADKYIKEAYVGNVSSSEPVSSDSEPSSFKSPIDFESLWEVNKDIYSWIEIADTKINYPIAQSQTNDSYYLDHSIDGVKNKNGTLFTESAFNSLDFNDPMTVIYGHDMKSGAMFGRLQSYSDSKYFNEHNIIKIYLPDRTLTYKVFAALPFSNNHILYSWNFTREDEFDNFIRNIKSTKSLLANFDDSIEVAASDKVIILSTCLKGDNTKRFLVLAVLSDEEK